MSESTYECSLSEELKAKAREELNEKEEWRARDIQALRDMVKAHPGLHARMDDEFLLRFLRARKFDYDRAYQLLLNFYTVRAENKDLFKCAIPSKAKLALSQGMTTLLPNCDKHGRRIMMDSPGNWKPEECGMLEIAKGITVNLETAIREEAIQVNGIVIVVDFTGYGMPHFKAFDRMFAKLVSSIMQDAFPMRVKKVFICNESPLFDIIFGIFKTFMKEKLISRFHMVGTDYTLLGEELGFENLPAEVGGKLGPAKDIQKNWWKKLEADEAYHQEQQQYYLDLPHQIVKKPQTDEVVQGLVGSYKKLGVE